MFKLNVVNMYCEIYVHSVHRRISLFEDINLDPFLDIGRYFHGWLPYCFLLCNLQVGLAEAPYVF